MNRHAIWSACWLALAVLFLALIQGAYYRLAGLGYAIVAALCVRESVISGAKAYKRWYDLNG